MTTATVQTHARSYEDRSADCLRNLIVTKNPFIFVRFGDGALECISGKPGHTCDGEVYSSDLGNELVRVWKLLFTRPRVFLGDWFSASFSPESPHGLYRSEYQALIELGRMNGDQYPNWIHFEALLLMRESESLVEFYRAVRKDPRRKLLMGPEAWRPASHVLQCDFLGIPVTPNLFKNYLAEIKSELNNREFDALLYGAGMAGNIPVIDHWSEHPEKTYVNLGSALDPVYRGRSRRQQLSTDRAQKLFESIVIR
jgi:hypothetical protein